MFSRHAKLTTSMLLTDVGNEMCWRQSRDFGDDFDRFRHQHPLYKAIYQSPSVISNLASDGSLSFKTLFHLHLSSNSFGFKSSESLDEIKKSSFPTKYKIRCSCWKKRLSPKFSSPSSTHFGRSVAFRVTFSHSNVAKHVLSFNPIFFKTFNVSITALLQSGVVLGSKGHLGSF